MANATQSTDKKPPASKAPAKANGQPAVKASRIYKGVIERYENGQLVSTEPAPTPKTAAPKVTPAKTPPPPTLATALKAAVSAKQTIIYVGKIGSDDIWEIKPIDLTDPSPDVHLQHYKGYEPQGKTVTKRWHEAERLFDDMLTKSGFTWIDGVQHTLVDEDL